MALKDELQGPQGLISKLRQECIPSPLEMARLARDRYIEKGGSFENVDHALDGLLVNEFAIYEEKKEELFDRFWPYVHEKSCTTRHPELREVMDVFLERCSLSPATAIYSKVVETMYHFSNSMSQSAKSRAGQSLENHIEFLLEEKGFKKGQDFITQTQVGTICLDFLFPSIEQYEEEPQFCCTCACQTTANDRFRLSNQQVRPKTLKRALTAIGCKNFGQNLQGNSLTASKLKEMENGGAKFVVLSAAMDARLKSSGLVMTYSEWFDELQKLKRFWE